jgi:probable phosphoglycerate mutase
MADRWPERLWLVRHGQSAGNVASDAAHAAGLPMLDIETRDVDVPLSPLGEQQAAALGAWFSRQPEPPQVVLTSPYSRAVATAQAVREAPGLDAAIECFRLDERLREREFGILDRLTRAGIEARYPEQAEARRRLGKFYHRAPGGESWCDVILRLRSALDTICLHHAGKRVLVVCHQVTVLCFRYLLENLDEATILGVDAERDVPNCGVTTYVRVRDGKGERLELHEIDLLQPMAAAATPVTSSPDRPAGPR